MTLPADPAARRLGVATPDTRVRAVAPGRVNLIGDHTDYAGGWVLPMAVDRSTTVDLRRHGSVLDLVSADSPLAVTLPLDGQSGPASNPEWSRYVHGVVATLRPHQGGSGVVSTTLPLGAGLSSSSALTVALALALGFEGTVLDLARLCQRAETLGSGVPGGIMDQLCAGAGVEDNALLIDCTELTVRPVPLPDGCEVIVAHCGSARTLVGSEYADRRRDVEAAATLIGPLRDVVGHGWDEIGDDRLRRRARHVVTENGRVLACAAALESGDVVGAGALMSESHRSLRDDFDVSTPDLGSLVEELEALDGVYGARLTGAGFGGCVVALAEAGTLDRVGELPSGRSAWVVNATAGASVVETG